MRLAAAVFALLLATASPAQSGEPIVIGSSHTIRSEPLGEQRRINVVLPPSYASETQRRYPVLYLIDGGAEQDLLHVAGVAQLGALWGRSSEAIVVGIETKDRRRELTHPTRDAELLKQYPTAGSSALFRQFIRDEVKPMIASTYRANGEDAVIGESLAGLFIVETWLREPALFDRYAAIDPSLWWDEESLVRAAAGEGEAGKPPLYVAVAREQLAERAGLDLLLPVARAGGRWCLAERADLFHATIYQQLTPQALQFLLPPAEAPPAEYGFEVRCSQKS